MLMTNRAPYRLPPRHSRTGSQQAKRCAAGSPSTSGLRAADQPQIGQPVAENAPRGVIVAGVPRQLDRQRCPQRRHGIAGLRGTGRQKRHNPVGCVARRLQPQEPIQNPL